MPLPITTVLLVGALAGGELHSVITVAVLGGLALLNEGARMLTVRPPAPPQSYEIPAARQRTPITYDDGDA